MTDKKIDELPAASALDGTEAVPMVQGGVTVQATAQDIADLGGGGGGQLVASAAKGSSTGVDTETTLWSATLPAGALSPTDGTTNPLLRLKFLGRFHNLGGAIALTLRLYVDSTMIGEVLIDGGLDANMIFAADVEMIVGGTSGAPSGGTAFWRFVYGLRNDTTVLNQIDEQDTSVFDSIDWTLSHTLAFKVVTDGSGSTCSRLYAYMEKASA